MNLSRISTLLPRRVLVTGGAGFVGSHITDALLSAGHRVLVVDNLSTGRQKNLARDAEFACLDIADTQLWTVMQQFRPEAVIHAAAQASVPVSMEQPQADARSNIMGSLNLIQASLRSAVSQFVYVNTGGALYGHPMYLPIDEAHPVAPISPYGLSKWTAEQYLLLLAGERMQTKVLRLANVYGPRQSPDTEAGVISVFAARMLDREPVTIYGDGMQTRDFVFVGDVARAAVKALAVEHSFMLHVSSGRGTSVREIFSRIAEATGYNAEPRFEEARAGDIRHSVLANRAAEDIMAWRPEWSLDRGIAETVRSLDVRSGQLAMATGA
ncbi:MAG: NAD-dependent epimerase/dehydratase family protein [bacterium]